ncbi:hypothetical protein H5410_057941 [Solanum commersonii]|uniref:Uncharacterized protein n=1 Tax=Solanum commersonii TaxID=4109 RepID=A0A9J5WRF4_SOLCO|nr:hypothetical protein H5410_057941 [Solanum commersonii]
MSNLQFDNCGLIQLAHSSVHGLMVDDDFQLDLALMVDDDFHLDSVQMVHWNVEDGWVQQKVKL